MSHKSFKGPLTNLFLAGILSIFTAFCFPFLTLLFGHVFKEFINYNLAVKIDTLNLTSNDYYCDLSNNTDIAGYLLPNGHHKLHVRVALLTFLNLAVSLLFFVLAALTRSLSAVAAAQMGRRLRLKYFSAIMRKHVRWFEGDWSSELPTLLLEGIQIIEIGVTCSIVLIQQLFVIIASLAIAFYVNWLLALVTSFLLPFFLFLNYILVKTISLIAAKEQDALSLASSVAEESLLFIETVKIFEGQDKEIHRYLYYIGRANKESRKILMLTALMVGFLYLFILTIFTVGSWFGFHLMVQCQCEAGDIILVTAEIVICGFSISELLPAIGEVFAAYQSAALIRRVITIKERSKVDLNPSDGMSLTNFEGGIEFSDVIFCYPSCPFPNILNNVSFKVYPGQTVALIGPNGCGKTTIFKLIQRLYDIQEGMIRFDNVDGKYLNLRWLRSQIGIVSLDSTLFNNVSISENIGYGQEDVTTMEEIICASKMANAHSFITDLPYGYRSLVGTNKKRGVVLTQEQDLLIGIARALIRNPKILLLDLSGCEFQKGMEEIVLSGVDKAKEGRTTIIIAHRLSTIQTADVIVGINEGRVVEMGSHNELMEKDGLYKSLVMSETYKNELANIDEVTIHSDDDTNHIDSNKLIEELRFSSNSNANDDFQSEEKTSELSPLLHKSTANTNNDARTKKTVLSLYREVLGVVFTRSHWLLLVLAIIFFIMAGATLSSFFILFEQLGEHFNNTDSVTLMHAADLYSPLFSVLGLIMMALNFIGYMILSICEENLSMGIRQKTLRGLLSQQLNWFGKRRNKLDTLSNMLSTDASNISQVLSIRIGSIGWSVTALLGALSAAFVLCWPIGLVLLPSYAWLLISGYLHSKFTKKFSDHRNMYLKEGKMMASDSINNFHTVVQFGIENIFIKRYNHLLKEPFRCDMKHAAILGVLYGLSQMLTFLFIGFGYLIGTFLILSLSFKFTYSDILTALFTIWFSSQVYKGKFDIITGLQEGAISSKRILNYFSKHSNSKTSEKQRKLPNKVQYSLQLENVWSAYDSKEKSPSMTSSQKPSPILSVNPGETLALVGPVLSHNSTVLSLVEKIHNPTAHCLLLDGVDICELNTKWLQRQFGIVSRYPVLFNMTVFDNIRYGVNYRYVRKDEIISIAKSAGVHDILQSLPQGYNTVVSFNGNNLSLEQRLSVAIARALIRNPKILLMDDTPLLNGTVSNALNKARKGRTAIVIANKMSTLMSANRIAVLHKGRVLEQGTHLELMEKRGAYFTMKDILEQF